MWSNLVKAEKDIAEDVKPREYFFASVDIFPL